jgi:hypothetical protein
MKKFNIKTKSNEQQHLKQQQKRKKEKWINKFDDCELALSTK